MALCDQIQWRREAKGWNLTQLATLAQVTKGYLSQLERGDRTINPSAEVIYRLALALGTSMEVLMEKRPSQPSQIESLPEALRVFALQHGLSDSELQMLAVIEYRGLRPKTQEDWLFLYEAIRRTCR